MAKEVQDKIEAAAEEYSGPYGTSLTRHPVKGGFTDGATHIIENPRDFGLVPLSDVEGLVNLVKRCLNHNCGDVSEWDDIIKELQAFEKKGSDG